MKFSLVIIMPAAVIFQAPTWCHIVACVVSFYLHDSPEGRCHYLISPGLGGGFGNSFVCVAGVGAGSSSQLLQTQACVNSGCYQGGLWRDEERGGQ